ncbi:MAG: hypothetical protein OEM25_05010 [Gammaproteobacteria bacterium]|nr:hypothetical protein [Gammaproteobacteria bacterium]
MSKNGFTESEIVACLADLDQATQGGYQGDIQTSHIGTTKVLIKSAAGGPLVLWLNRLLLRHEYQVYLRLAGVDGIPECYGFFKGRYLMLQYIEGQTLRHAEIVDHDAFFAEMRALLERIHARSVAHGDLKRKDNIIVGNDSHPYLVDFGVSTFRKPGFRPVNRFWHSFCRQHDLNAWIKHKYKRRFQDMSAEDAALYRPLLIERLARRIKRLFVRRKDSNDPQGTEG